MLKFIKQQSVWQFAACVALLLATIFTVVNALDRTKPQGRRVDSADPDRKPFTSKCGTKHDVAIRAARCLSPIFDIVEGRNIKEAKSDSDIEGHCKRFEDAEKCIRTSSKDCLEAGLHKTASATMAASSRRFRLKECKSPESRSKYIAPIKCVIKERTKTQAMYANLTSMAHSIHELPLPAEERVVKLCCLLELLENESKKQFASACPESLDTILGLQHALTDDARNSICAKPKCTGVLNKLPKAKAKNGVNFVEPLLLIMFDI